ncbi:unnamed protein product [Medioppia subpectinata]|uniref:Uncharacterized protein n=1 Tax=Medioppia subpectinata TaxID=1979941 RepID=A0A7R9KDA3_9ACAR|nr:unnamed protein product [Medioppia subpectinata]CAG2101127.1 unnamed protein product [Medioppia subpectinata]
MFESDEQSLVPRVADTRPEGRPVAATGGDSDHESAAHYLPKHLLRHSSQQSLSSPSITSSHRQPHHRHRHHHHLHHNQRHIHQNSSASVAATAPAANPRQHKLSAHIAHQNINSYVNNNNNNNNNRNDNNFNSIVFNGSANVRQIKTRASPTVSVANPVIDLRVLSTKQLMLYSRCSQQYIYFLNTIINTTREKDNSLALLSLETIKYDNNLGIRIKSKVGGVYLCFNNRGRLTTKS